MNDALSFGLLCFTSFFTLINPLSTLPVFMTMTAGLSEKERTQTARKASIVALITIIIFAFSGQLLFKFFGISVNSFRVVGGVIFFIMGMDMLQARLGQVKIKDSEVKTYVNDISVTPLAIPMICGPGAITNSIVLMEDASTLTRKIILFGMILLVMLITYLVFLQLFTNSQNTWTNGHQCDDAFNGIDCHGDRSRVFLQRVKTDHSRYDKRIILFINSS